MDIELPTQNNQIDHVCTIPDMFPNDCAIWTLIIANYISTWTRENLILFACNFTTTSKSAFALLHVCSQISDFYYSKNLGKIKMPHVKIHYWLVSIAEQAVLIKTFYLTASHEDFFLQNGPLSYLQLEDLKRSPDLLNNVKIGHGQLRLIIQTFCFGQWLFWSSDLK